MTNLLSQMTYLLLESIKPLLQSIVRVNYYFVMKALIIFICMALEGLYSAYIVGNVYFYWLKLKGK